MECLTRDKEEIVIGNEYYRENGDVLHVVGLVPEKSTAIVYSYVEGDAMGCKLYPSGHTEIEIPYEYESEEFTVGFNQLYAEPPIFVWEPRIKAERDKLSAIATKIGLAHIELKAFEKEARDKKENLEKELAILNETIRTTKEEVQDIINKLQ